MKAKTKTPAKARVKLETVSSEQLKVTRTRTMPAGQFKAQCLAIIDEVHNRHEQVIITKFGKPMARLVPIGEKPDSIIGAMVGKIHILGDIVEPITDPQDWDSEIFPPEDDRNSRRFCSIRT